MDEEPYVPTLSEREREELLREWLAAQPDLGSVAGVKAERARITELARTGVLGPRDAEAGLAALDGMARSLELVERERR